MAKRTTAQVLDALFGVPISGGTIRQAEQATPEVVPAPVEEARADVHEPRVAHLDETSGRQGAKRAWLWGAVPSFGTGFLGRLARGGQGAHERLGEHCGGILVTERDRADNGYPVRWRQLGWAPLLRDCEARRSRGGASEESGAALLAQAPQMGTWWQRGRAGRGPARRFAPL